MVKIVKKMGKKVHALYADAYDRIQDWWYDFRVRMNWECITSLPEVLKITPPLDSAGNNGATIVHSFLRDEFFKNKFRSVKI